jgi:hypothetical protein
VSVLRYPARHTKDVAYTRKEQRRAGAHARSLARGASYMRLFYLGLAALALYLGYHSITVKPLHVTNRPLLVLSGVLLVLALFQAAGERKNSAKARVGATNESRVARVLSKTNTDYLINSAMLGVGGDADHVLLGPCLAVVETKSGRGPLSVRGHSLVSGSKIIPGDPVAQVKRQAAALGRIAGSYCDAIVCVADTTTPIQIDRGVTLCSLSQLPGVIAALPARISQQDAANLNDQVRHRDRANR